MSKCSKDPRFLGILGNRYNLTVEDGDRLIENWTAVYCELGRWKQSVMATALSKRLTVWGKEKALSDFNAPAFEALAATGQTSSLPKPLDSNGSPVNLGTAQLGYPNARYQVLECYGAADPAFPNRVDMVPAIQLLSEFGLGGFSLRNYPNDTLSCLLDPIEVSKSHSDAYKLLFFSF